MHVDSLVRCLEQPDAAAAWLRSVGARRWDDGRAELVALADAGVPLELLAGLCGQLAEHLPQAADPDRVLTLVRRFVASARSPLALASLFDRDRAAVPILLRMFDVGDYLAEMLIRDPEGFDLLRLTDGAPANRELLVDEVRSEIEQLADERGVGEALARYKNRETLRIAYGDVVLGQPVEVVMEQLSILAEALCEAAFTAAWRSLAAKRGRPRAGDGSPATMAVLALGSLAGRELDYAGSIELLCLYQGDGFTDGARPLDNRDFFARVAEALVRTLAEPTSLPARHTDQAPLYRVHVRSPLADAPGPWAFGVDQVLRHYELNGRTWERQAFLKARPIAGHFPTAARFLTQIEAWVFRRYLVPADITGLRAWRRRIIRRLGQSDEPGPDATSGDGPRLRSDDIEQVLQFLQLRHGGETTAVRGGNTLAALAALATAGCVSQPDAELLGREYRSWLAQRNRWQIQHHPTAQSPPVAPPPPLLDAEQTRERLVRLLRESIADENESASPTEPETDLVLDPQPSAAAVAAVLERHRFRNVAAAYQNLNALARERIPYLSTRRCRNYLATIAPRLLHAIAATADPDDTLENLCRVSDSLGGKGVLWELLSVHPPSLALYVRLCAASPYLTRLLMLNPGMIDELLDSLQLNSLPTPQSLAALLKELARGTTDLAAVLAGFKNSQVLRVGVRELLGKDDPAATCRAYADIADVCLSEVAGREYDQLLLRYGVPATGELDQSPRPVWHCLMALGRLGRRDMQQRSPLELLVLYEAEGHTRPVRPGRAEITTCQHFFSQLAQRIVKVMTIAQPDGRLYEWEPRPKPLGRSGTWATSAAELERYFAEESGQPWERAALSHARPVVGDAAAKSAASDAVVAALGARPPIADDGNSPGAIRP